MSILNKFHLTKKLDRLCLCCHNFGQQQSNSKRFYSSEASEEEKESPGFYIIFDITFSAYS